ncbi:MAG: zf-TFIIB domain-containing protein, partial [Dictyoglomaceae bacterium]|nr:zf-TFIIB domain-containing protein [Dictyoglomaceae bacterium]
EQCPNCYGIWFDKWELVALNPDKVKDLEYENILPSSCVPTICPKDQSSLRILKDPVIPKDINIYFCPNCLGTWVSLEDLLKYKEFQKEKIKTKEKNRETSKELEEKIEKLLSYQEKGVKGEVEELEDKVAGIVSVIFIILRILSYFLK